MKRLSAKAQSILNSGRIETFAQIKIKGQICNDVIDYQFGYDKSFGAASARIDLNNQEGKYSPKGEQAIHWNDEVEIIEGLKVGSEYEIFPKFKGLVRQTVPSIEKGIARIQITALDKAVRLEDLDLHEHFFEADKEPIGGYAGIKLKPCADGEGFAQIYDFYNKDWDEEGANPVTDIAPNPIPRIRVRNLSDYLSDPKWEGFEIHYREGQLILNSPIDTRQFDIYAIFSYYKIADGLYVEDLIKGIITAPDGYGNYPISEDDIKTDLLTEDGVSVDTMTPNYTTETIDGIDYPAGQLWYLSYNNVITDLIAGDFTIPGGASFVSFNNRYGRLVLDTAISVDSSVTCDKNYEFCTVQATGIQTPYISFPAREIPNRFEALNQLRKLLAPNYIFQTRGSDKIWGRYINQKVEEDYTLALKERLEYSPDTDVYTRVKLFGENASPVNLMTNANFVCGYEYIAHASDWELGIHSISNGVCTYLIKDPQTRERVQILSGPQAPVISLGALKFGTKVFVLSRKDSNSPPNLVYNQFQDTIVGGFLTKQEKNHIGETWYGLWFIGALDTTKPIVLKKYGGNPDETIYPDDQYLKFNDAKHQWEWTPPKLTDAFQIIVGANFYVNLLTPNRDGNLEIDYINNLIRIPLKYIGHTNETANLVKAQPVSGEWSFPSGMSFLTDGTFDYHHWADAGDNSITWRWTTIDFKDWSFVNEIQFYRQIYQGSGENETRGSRLAIELHTMNGWEQVFMVGSGDSGRQNLFFLMPGIPDYATGPIYGTVAKLQEAYYANRIRIGIRLGYWRRWGCDYTATWGIDEIKVIGYTAENIVKASFWYSANADRITNIDALKDGLYRTQVQSVYRSKPLKGSTWATFDFGSEKKVQAIDLVPGFWIPDENVPQDKANIQMNLTLEYALDAEDINHAVFYEISKEATGFDLSSGDKVSFEPDELGENFKMRWLRIKIEDVGQAESSLGERAHVIAFAEIAVYSDIYLEAEAKLVANPEEEDETHLYDSLGLLATVGDRLYKISEISKILNTQQLLDRRAKGLLREFVKENSKCSAQVAHASHLELGMTVAVNDPHSKVFSGSEQNYFIDAISVSGGKANLTLARYE